MVWVMLMVLGVVGIRWRARLNLLAPLRATRTRHKVSMCVFDGSKERDGSQFA